MGPYEYELAQRRMEELRTASERLHAKDEEPTPAEQREVESLSAQVRLALLRLARGEAR